MPTDMRLSSTNEVAKKPVRVCVSKRYKPGLPEMARIFVKLLIFIEFHTIIYFHFAFADIGEFALYQLFFER